MLRRAFLTGLLAASASPLVMPPRRRTYSFLWGNRDPGWRVFVDGAFVGFEWEGPSGLVDVTGHLPIGDWRDLVMVKDKATLRSSVMRTSTDARILLGCQGKPAFMLNGPRGASALWDPAKFDYSRAR